jgi:hypothetical protein
MTQISEADWKKFITKLRKLHTPLCFICGKNMFGDFFRGHFCSVCNLDFHYPPNSKGVFRNGEKMHKEEIKRFSKLRAFR